MIRSLHALLRWGLSPQTPGTTAFRPECLIFSEAAQAASAPFRLPGRRSGCVPA